MIENLGSVRDSLGGDVGEIRGRRVHVRNQQRERCAAGVDSPDQEHRHQPAEHAVDGLENCFDWKAS